MKKFTFFLLLSILFLIVPSCKKTDSSDPPPVAKDPYAMFTYSIKSNGIVSFTNTSTDATSYQWDFGDLTTSTSGVVTFEHQYSKNGTYKATLTAYGNGKSAGAYANLNITSLSGNVPTVETDSITNITQTTATSGGNVISDGGANVTERGVCWSTAQNPTINDIKTIDGSGTGSFTSNVAGLTAKTLYYIRAYATNSSGTAYGNQVDFTTNSSSGPQPCPGIPTVTYEGQTYNTVQIGTQCWFKENLNIGTMINGNDTSTDNGIIEKYCYNNEESNCAVYGGLYAWDEMMQYVTTEGARGICPAGWHVPTDAEWTTLTTYLGGESIASGKLKEIGLTHWASPNTGATNESGFTALPGGIRKEYTIPPFSNLASDALFWSSSQDDASNNAWYRSLYNHSEIVTRGISSKVCGLSARCVKD